MTIASGLSTRTLTRNGWRLHHALIGIALAAIGMAVTWQAWIDLFRVALKDEESSQILLVPIIVVWLVWTRRGRIRHCKPTGQWVGSIITLIGAILYLWGEAKLIESFWYGGAVIVVMGCLLTVLGKQVLIEFLPVFLCLIFLVPVPRRVRQRIAIPLEGSTARVTQEVCELMGMSIERTGNLLHINGIDVEIGQACNGMRMTFALMLVSLAFALTTPMYGYVRVLIVLLSPLCAVLCNVIRLVPTVWVFGNCATETAQRFHDLSGWAMLFVAFVSLMSVIRLLQWFAVPVVPFPLAID